MVELHYLAAISAFFAWNDPVKLARVGPRPVRFMNPMGRVASPIASRAPWHPPKPPWYVLKSLPTPGCDNVGFMRSKWIDLMMHRGALACAEMTYSRNNSPSNFRAMCRARVMYEAAVEAIGKDVVAKSMAIEDAALRRAGLRPKLVPRPDAA